MWWLMYSWQDSDVVILFLFWYLDSTLSCSTIVQNWDSWEEKPYLINSTMQMDSGRLFTVNTNYVSSCFDEIWHPLVWFYNHLQYFNKSQKKLSSFETSLVKYMYEMNTRCTSKGKSVTGRNASTTRGPIVMFGTKRPSITSIWIQSQPANSTAFT